MLSSNFLFECDLEILDVGMSANAGKRHSGDRVDATLQGRAGRSSSLSAITCTACLILSLATDGSMNTET